MITTLSYSNQAWDGEHESETFFVGVQTFALSLLVVNNTGEIVIVIVVVIVIVFVVKTFSISLLVVNSTSENLN